LRSVPWGARFGLAVAGLASGFVSRHRHNRCHGHASCDNSDCSGAAVAGAVLSTRGDDRADVRCSRGHEHDRAAGNYQSAALRRAGCRGLMAAIFTIKALRGTERVDSQPGHAFSFSSAIILAASLSGILVVSAALRENFGEIGVIVGAALAGFADTAFGRRLDRFGWSRPGR